MLPGHVQWSCQVVLMCGVRGSRIDQSLSRMRILFWCVAGCTHTDSDHMCPTSQRSHPQVSKAHNKPGLLTYPAVSCWALLELTGRWSSQSERSGGLRDASARAATGELLLGLAQCLVADGKFFIPIVFSESWEVRWPRPADQAPSLLLGFSADGTFSFASWVEALQVLPAGQVHVGTAWLRGLQLSVGARPSFIALFAATMRCKKLRSLHAQSLWHSGWRPQVLMQASLQGRRVEGVECTPWKMLDLLDQPYQLDKYLAIYIEAAQRR